MDSLKRFWISSVTTARRPYVEAVMDTREKSTLLKQAWFCDLFDDERGGTTSTSALPLAAPYLKTPGVQLHVPAKQPLFGTPSVNNLKSHMTPAGVQMHVPARQPLFGTPGGAEEAEDTLMRDISYDGQMEPKETIPDAEPWEAALRKLKDTLMRDICYDGQMEPKETIMLNPGKFRDYIAALRKLKDTLMRGLHCGSNPAPGQRKRGAFERILQVAAEQPCKYIIVR
eukprot:gene4877-34639_t